MPCISNRWDQTEPSWKNGDFSIYPFTQLLLYAEETESQIYQTNSASHKHQRPTHCWEKSEEKKKKAPSELCAQEKCWRLCIPNVRVCLLMLVLPFSVQLLNYSQMQENSDYWFPVYISGSDYSVRSQRVTKVMICCCSTAEKILSCQPNLA